MWPPREIKNTAASLASAVRMILNSSHDNAAHLTAWGLARQPGCRSHEASWGSRHGCQLDAPLGALPPKLHWCSRTGGCSKWCCGRAPHPDNITKAKQKNQASESSFTAAEGCSKKNEGRREQTTQTRKTLVLYHLFRLASELSIAD